ncbi:MAG: hypothetical protein ACJAXW_002170 [Candidatus Azotimanducaceae bacterium]|jgi:hypothetical protein
MAGIQLDDEIHLQVGHAALREVQVIFLIPGD